MSYLSYILRLYTCISIVLSAQDCPIGWLKFNSKCFSFSRQAVTMDEAEILCGTFKGIVVEPRTPAEMQFIAGEVINRETFGNEFYWMGFHESVKFKNGWHYNSDNTPVNIWNWYRNATSGPLFEDRCVASLKSTHGEWLVISCNKQAHFICEKSNTETNNVLCGVRRSSGRTYTNCKKENNDPFKSGDHLDLEIVVVG